MPFDRAGLHSLGSGAWVYRTRDDAAAVNTPGYWTPAWPLLRRGDAVFRTTLDGAGQVASAGRHVITAAGRTGVSSATGFDAGSIITPPPGDAVLTSIAWNLRITPEILGGGAGGGAINYAEGLYDFRADFDSLVTTANGAVSALTSAQSLPGAWSQGTAANQPAHDSAGDYVRFAAASSTDAASGDFLLLSTQMADRYRAQGASLGVVYLLFRLTSAATWLTTLFRVGVNNTNFTGRDRRAYHVGLFTGPNRIIGIRGSATSNQNALINNHPAVNEWCGLAFVLNDSRVSGVRNGASDQISRVFVKTKAGGTFATMQAVSSAVLDTTAAWTSTSPPDGTESNLLRARYNNSATVEGFGNVDIHSVGFDAQPPITDAGIEAVLDTLLGRV